ncbi:MAG: cupin domain-containing protein [Epsilonproteobacteria bacterium]|nr:MAG: cupin domain-containing protein [Campylobacterota bacterium]
MNIYDYITPQNGETFTTLLSHKNIKINRIVSSDELDKTEYIQKEHEWLVLLEGEATLLVDKEEKNLRKGDTLFIPAQTPHRVLHTQKGTVWLTVHIF